MTERVLGILVMSPLDGDDRLLLKGIVDAASSMGVRVELFFMADGINQILSPFVQGLNDNGSVSMSFCALNASERGLDRAQGYPWGMDDSSQYELACIVERAHRFLYFT